MTPRIWWQAALIAAVAALCVPTLIRLTDASRFQWDFRTYYYAARTFDAGGDPYRIADIAKLSPFDVRLPFVYPPTALFFFKLWSWVSFDAAVRLLLSAKLIAMAALLWIWSRAFIREPVGLAFLLFAFLAFNGAVFADLRSGNPSVFEQLAIWTGLLFFMRERYWRFCACILAAAFIKLQPLLLLGLLLTAPKAKGLKPLAGALAVALSTAAAFALWRPEIWQSFLVNLYEQNTEILLYENGRINPSGFAFLEHVYWLTGRLWGVDWPAALKAIVHVCVPAAIVCITWLRVRPQVAAGPSRITVYLCLLAYALILPRFKDYSFILLIPIAYDAASRIGERAVSRALILAACCLSATSPMPGLTLGFTLLWEYFPLILAFFLWLYYCHEAHRRTADV